MKGAILVCYPLPPRLEDSQPAPVCLRCNDSGVCSYWYDLGIRGAVIGSELCECQKKRLTP